MTNEYSSHRIRFKNFLTKMSASYNIYIPSVVYFFALFVKQLGLRSFSRSLTADKCNLEQWSVE